MKNPAEPSQDKLSNWDPFPEPRTIPTGWDLTELPHAPAETSAVFTEEQGFGIKNWLRTFFTR